MDYTNVRVKKVIKTTRMGSKIQKRLDKLGLTQAELARKSGLSTGHISDLVNGKRGKCLSIPTPQALCNALEVDPKFFYPRIPTCERPCPHEVYMLAERSKYASL